jgi:hypothetical protein
MTNIKYKSFTSDEFKSNGSTLGRTTELFTCDDASVFINEVSYGETSAILCDGLAGY